MLQLKTAEEEMFRLGAVVQRQNRFIHQADSDRHHHETALRTRLATLEHELGMKTDLAVSVLGEKTDLEALLRKESSTLRKVEDDRDDLLSEIERLKEAHADQITCLKVSRAADLKAHQEQKEELEVQLRSITLDYSATISDLQTRIETHAQTIRNLELEKVWLKEDCNKLENSAKSAAADAACLKLEHVKELEEYKGKHEAELQEIKVEQDKARLEVAELRKQHAAKIDCLKLEHAKELEDQRKEHANLMRHSLLPSSAKLSNVRHSRAPKPRGLDPHDIIILDHEPEELAKLSMSNPRPVTPAPMKPTPPSPLAALLSSSLQRASLPSTDLSQSHPLSLSAADTTQSNSRKRKSSNPLSEQAAKKTSRDGAC